MTHHREQIDKLKAELQYWAYFANGGDAGEVAPATQRMAKKLIKQANHKLAKLIKEEASE